MLVDKQKALTQMIALANRIDSIIVDMQIRKAQMLARSVIPHKNKPAK